MCLGDSRRGFHGLADQLDLGVLETDCATTIPSGTEGESVVNLIRSGSGVCVASSKLVH